MNLKALCTLKARGNKTLRVIGRIYFDGPKLSAAQWWEENVYHTSHGNLGGINFSFVKIPPCIFCRLISSSTEALPCFRQAVKVKLTKTEREVSKNESQPEDEAKEFFMADFSEVKLQWVSPPSLSNTRLRFYMIIIMLLLSQLTKWLVFNSSSESASTVSTTEAKSSCCA